jgi:hypothetical protein
VALFFQEALRREHERLERERLEAQQEDLRRQVCNGISILHALALMHRLPSSIGCAVVYSPNRRRFVLSESELSYGDRKLCCRSERIRRELGWNWLAAKSCAAR